MTARQTSRKEEHKLYEDPEYQRPQGPGRRRKSRFTELVPVRFAPEILAAVRQEAEAEDRSVSSWIRRAVEAALAGPGKQRTRRTG